ncbi:HD domain-containing protein [Fictibacillus enclensis]|uniref:HD domain-containing protein n=1 Tax=Fictibacillus enclensis TaxID=1017270 RepID=UPI0025A2E179|nr:HD domain-containing protein [Fictibacillus enclensis]MDM5336567.1 HD domain-containing protein [Fictibacillus enclensis]
MEGKIISIADSVHGNINISELEKMIISTPPFNRLHNILQNSTVFLTYPSNQTKRFAHSLGVMHLGGQMLYFSILNANQSVVDKFLEEINEEITKIIEEPSFKQILRDRLGSKGKIVDNYKDIVMNETLYLTNTPRNIKKDFLFAYTVLLQSVRCSALLHDIGHPPFSHITEFALKDIYNNINSKKEPATKREETFLTIVKPYLKNDEKKVDLHEQVGNTIADRLMEAVIRDHSKLPSSSEHDNQQILYLIVHKFTHFILQDKKVSEGKLSIFESIHKLVAGTIDCDRLDYVTRDINSSGFNRGNIEYDRLTSSMKLMFDEENGNYLFCFGIRTISTIEDFFNRRWFLYKYIIYHHRVIKTDSLLGRAIVKLAEDYLQEKEEDSELIGENVIPNDISGLWRAIKEAYSDDYYFNALIQWDDAWLLTILRQQYLKTYIESEEIVKEQLEELLSNKKNYFSVIKRMSDFLEIDNYVLELLRNDSEKLSRLEQLKDLVNRSERVISKSLLNKVFNFIENQNEQNMLANKDGFLIYNFSLLFQSLDVKNFHDELLDGIKKAIGSFVDKENHIITSKNLKTGLNDSPTLHHEDKIVTLRKISNLEDELLLNKALFPMFFIYLPVATSVDKEKIKRSIADGILNEIAALITELLPAWEEKVHQKTN